MTITQETMRRVIVWIGYNDLIKRIEVLRKDLASLAEVTGECVEMHDDMLAKAQSDVEWMIEDERQEANEPI